MRLAPPGTCGLGLTCSRCGSPMRILTVITEPEQVHKIPVRATW
jgi:hypothetical protein